MKHSLTCVCSARQTQKLATFIAHTYNSSSLIYAALCVSLSDFVCEFAIQRNRMDGSCSNTNWSIYNGIDMASLHLILDQNPANDTCGCVDNGQTYKINNGWNGNKYLQWMPFFVCLIYILSQWKIYPFDTVCIDEPGE